MRAKRRFTTIKLVAETFYKVTLITEVNSAVPLFSNVSVWEGLVKNNPKKDRKLVQPEVRITRCVRPDHSQFFHCSIYSFIAFCGGSALESFKELTLLPLLFEGHLHLRRFILYYWMTR